MLFDSHSDFIVDLPDQKCGQRGLSVSDSSLEKSSQSPSTCEQITDLTRFILLEMLRTAKFPLLANAEIPYLRAHVSSRAQNNQNQPNTPFSSTLDFFGLDVRGRAFKIAGQSIFTG